MLRAVSLRLRVSVSHLGTTVSRRVLVDDAALHDEDDAADGRDVFEGVAVERDDVGLEAGRDGAEAVA